MSDTHNSVLGFDINDLKQTWYYNIIQYNIIYVNINLGKKGITYVCIYKYVFVTEDCYHVYEVRVCSPLQQEGNEIPMTM